MSIKRLVFLKRIENFNLEGYSLMQVYKLILILVLCLSFSRCIQNPFQEKPSKPDTYSNLVFYYLTVYLPAEKKKLSCMQENALSLCANCGCTSNRISSGLIYEDATNKKIMVDTIVPGLTVKCLCENLKVPFSGDWLRGTEIVDTIPINPNTSLIWQFGTNREVINSSIQYKLNYGDKENLFCLVDCTTYGQEANYQYQILKIR